jgi:transcriptional regulator with XRE-family HTH domain
VTLADDARAFAVAAHGEQRYGDHPYAVHLDAVAQLAQPFGEEAVAVAYLHDTVEDTDATLEDVGRRFGPRVAACVALLTDAPGANRGERKTKTYAKLAQVQGPSELALVVNAADRLVSLKGLASKSGVSRSMISLIERGESSPTAVVLEKLAGGLGVLLPALFEATDTPPGPLARRADQPQWKDPASGYVRRNVSPPGASMQIVEVRFPPGARVAFENGGDGVQQQLWVLQGTIDVTVGRERHRLRDGDCLAMQLDRPTMFHNPTRKTTRYAVVVSGGRP